MTTISIVSVYVCLCVSSAENTVRVCASSFGQNTIAHLIAMRMCLPRHCKRAYEGEIFGFSNSASNFYSIFIQFEFAVYTHTAYTYRSEEKHLSKENMCENTPAFLARLRMAKLISTIFTLDIWMNECVCRTFAVDSRSVNILHVMFQVSFVSAPCSMFIVHVWKKKCHQPLVSCIISLELMSDDIFAMLLE